MTDVRALQQALNKLSDAGLAVDGIYGPATRAAVRSFQAQAGLAADGEAGPKTQAALDAALRARGFGILAWLGDLFRRN